MNRSFFLACILVLPIVTMSGPASAAGADTSEVVACTISAWSIDKDPKGLNVRAGPQADAAVIARLPQPLNVEGYEFAVEVSITGSQNGWLRIDRATLNNYVSDEEPTVVFEGEGWVSGQRLGFSVEGRYLYQSPSKTAPVAVDFLAKSPAAPDSGPDHLTLDRVHACRGSWAEVEGTYFGKRIRGWTNDICSNQVTTCP